MDAVEDYRAVQTGVTAVSRALSAKRGEVAAAVGRVLDENARLKERAATLSAELVRVKAESAAATDGNICVFDGILDEVAQRELTNLLMENAAASPRYSPAATRTAGVTSSAAKPLTCAAKPNASTPR